MINSKDVEYVVVGRLLGPHGVRGEIKVHYLTEEKETLLSFPDWLLGPDGGPMQRYSLVSGRSSAKGLIVRLAGIDDRDAAQALSGTDVWIMRSQLPELDQDQFYWADLIGSKVVTEDGEELGEVQHLFETGANDVMSVNSQGEERLIPFTSEVVLQVDADARVVLVRLLPGM
ncbi:MAG: ribosome maturation factor RimM [Magnetococcales bacterium]|nr:ribosome maturation factor RimM [Magnetococcales bacterium]